MTADTLLGPDQQPCSNLMRTAVRLLSHGSPITVTELAEAAGVDAADLANAPAGEDIEYDDERRIVGWGLTLNPTPHTFVVNGHRLYTWCAADTFDVPDNSWHPGTRRIDLPRNGYRYSSDRRPGSRGQRRLAGHCGDLDPRRAGLGRRPSACQLLQSRSFFRDRSGRGRLARPTSPRDGAASRRCIPATRRPAEPAPRPRRPRTEGVPGPWHVFAVDDSRN